MLRLHYYTIRWLILLLKSYKKIKIKYIEHYKIIKKILEIVLNHNLKNYFII